MYDWKSLALATALIAGVVMLPEGFAAPRSSIADAEVPSEKTTELGLYLSSEDAYAFITQNPDALFIDTRDPLEVSVMGHPVGIDAIVPISIHSNTFVESRGEFALARNPDFNQMWDRVASYYGISRSDIIIVTCGNGRRSAQAVNQLAAAGYTNVWHIVDGYDGEDAEDRDGRNTKNAWHLAGLPWTKSHTLPGAELVRLID